MTEPKTNRRNSDAKNKARLRTLLNEDQRLVLADLERFGWELKFVRRPLFQASIPVVFDADRKTWAVLEADGTLNTSPGFDIRSD
jgi:hypothetical protein